MKFSQANQTSSKETARETIWLWHRRLGHLSFGYLRKLKPHFFPTVNDSKFQYDTYDLAKSHRIPYLPSLNKSSISFAVIHSDVWGPIRIPSISKVCYFVTFIDECTRMTWVIVFLPTRVMSIKPFRNFITWLAPNTKHRYVFYSLTMVRNMSMHFLANFLSILVFVIRPLAPIL
jgi:hypothetical protein